MTRTFNIASIPAASASIDPTRSSTIRRKLQTLLLAAFAILSVTACLADPEVDEDGEIDNVASVSQAVQGCTVKSGDGSFVCLSNDRRWLVVCDEDADGNYAYARTYRNGVVQPPLYDQNGAAWPCSLYPAHVNSLDSYNICVQDEGCGSPRYP